MNPPPQPPVAAKRPLAPETVLNKKKAADILKFGTLQPQPCTNCEKKQLKCYMDLSISNLCHYCVERKGLCSRNPNGRAAKEARMQARRTSEVQMGLGGGPQPVEQSQDYRAPAPEPQPKPKQYTVDISLVPGQTSRKVWLPAGEYQTFQVAVGGFLRTAVLLPANPANYEVPDPRDENGYAVVPAPIIRSVVPGRHQSEEE